MEQKYIVAEKVNSNEFSYVFWNKQVCAVQFHKAMQFLIFIISYLIFVLFQIK